MSNLGTRGLGLLVLARVRLLEERADRRREPPGAEAPPHSQAEEITDIKADWVSARASPLLRALGYFGHFGVLAPTRADGPLVGLAGTPCARPDPAPRLAGSGLRPDSSCSTFSAAIERCSFRRSSCSPASLFRGSRAASAGAAGYRVRGPASPLRPRDCSSSSPMDQAGSLHRRHRPRRISPSPMRLKGASPRPKTPTDGRSPWIRNTSGRGWAWATSSWSAADLSQRCRTSSAPRPCSRKMSMRDVNSPSPPKL